MSDRLQFLPLLLMYKLASHSVSVDLPPVMETINFNVTVLNPKVISLRTVCL